MNGRTLAVAAGLALMLAGCTMTEAGYYSYEPGYQYTPSYGYGSSYGSGVPYGYAVPRYSYGYGYDRPWTHRSWDDDRWRERRERRYTDDRRNDDRRHSDRRNDDRRDEGGRRRMVQDVPPPPAPPRSPPQLAPAPPHARAETHRNPLGRPDPNAERTREIMRAFGR